MECNPAPFEMKHLKRIFFSSVLALSVLSGLYTSRAANAPAQGVLATAYDISLGSENAPIKIIEYSSMTCHFCADFHLKTLPKLKEKYIDKGLVRYTFRFFSPDEYGLAAAVLIATSPVMTQQTLITKIFEKQDQWMTPEYVKELAFIVGKPVEEVSRIVNDKKVREALAADFIKAEQNLKIEATPFFIINGVVIPYRPSFEKLESLIAPKAKTDAPQKGTPSVLSREKAKASSPSQNAQTAPAA
ncbi:MAG: hypothetical protein C0514_05375 [Candidatus Puniceispirillum sp.]|nr:hypothetical protein [Candidatus Puniceispirillum sp.]